MLTAKRMSVVQLRNNTLSNRRYANEAGNQYLSGVPGAEPMTKVEKIEQEVRQLSERELTSFRAWFSEYDAASWDRQVELDVAGGRLDALADAALAQHATGRSRKL